MQIKGIIYTFLIKSFHTSKSNSTKRLSKKERDNFTLDEFLKQVLVGNLLGDIYMRRSSDTANVRAVFRQGSTNAEYLAAAPHLGKKPPTVAAGASSNL